MEEIAISKFKATCLEVLERVRRTRKTGPRPQNQVMARQTTARMSLSLINRYSSPSMVTSVPEYLP